MDYKKYVLLWNKYEYQHFADIFGKIFLIHFMTLVSCYILPEIHQETRVFLMFSGEETSAII